MTKAEETRALIEWPTITLHQKGYKCAGCYVVFSALTGPYSPSARPHGSLCKVAKRNAALADLAARQDREAPAYADVVDPPVLNGAAQACGLAARQDAEGQPSRRPFERVTFEMVREACEASDGLEPDESYRNVATILNSELECARIVAMHDDQVLAELIATGEDPKAVSDRVRR